MQQVYTSGRPRATLTWRSPLIPTSPSPAPESTLPAGSSTPLIPIRLLLRLLRSLLTLSRIPFPPPSPPPLPRPAPHTVAHIPSVLSSSTTPTPPARPGPKTPNPARPPTPQTPPKCTPPHLKSFLEKTLIAREATHSAPRIALTLAPESGRSQALPTRNASLG